VATRAGGEEAFISASSAERKGVLQAVESECFEAFRALVALVLQDYYETPSVLAALGWRDGAPQPQGHTVTEADAATLRSLETIRARGPIWRRVT
jgi:hypothetical protein